MRLERRSRASITGESHKNEQGGKGGKKERTGLTLEILEKMADRQNSNWGEQDYKKDDRPRSVLNA